MALYPLKFVPRFVEKIWGGRKLEVRLRKSLPPEKPIGESWELYDFPPGVVQGESGWVSAKIANGGFAGRTLHELIVQFGKEILGDLPLLSAGQFPILTKFLDAREDLSVQVHPDEKYAAKHRGAFLKNEAWYILQADAGSRLLKGLRPGVTRQQFEAAIAEGTVESLIGAIPAKERSVCIFLAAPFTHLAQGILAAEVQTASDTTYRVFDFNRIDATTGKSRKLHVAEAMECIDFSGAKVPQVPRSHVAGLFTTVSRLASCPQFTLEKVRMTEGVEEPVPYDQPVIWIMLQGKAEVRVDGVKEATTLSPYQTVLLPAKMKNPVIKTMADCQWLEVTFPGMTGEGLEGSEL